MFFSCVTYVSPFLVLKSFCFVQAIQNWYKLSPWSHSDLAWNKLPKGLQNVNRFRSSSRFGAGYFSLELPEHTFQWFPLLCPDSQTKRDISAPSSCVLSRELLYRTKFRNFITALSKPWWGGSQAGNCPFPDASCFEKAGYALQVRGQPCQAPLEVQPTLPFT